ncbi:c-type cytochrome [bacterium]|nr:c-type cytochrome [bacterium]
MDYPFWDQPIGYGLLMAMISILHVFISHFAIGGGLYLVVAETSARKRDDQPMLDYLHGLSRFFVLVTLVLGALTGVGIWFVIGLLSPAGTDLLIHNFVWGWATEWTFFVVEIAAAIIYYYGFRTMTASNHIKVGWIYFVAAWLSLVVINGILAFMLTPGAWLESGSFWAGFFNPTYFSSLFFRTGVCILLAGLFTMAVASKQKDDAFRGWLVRYNAWWAIIGLIIMVPTFYWYWKAIPAEIITTALASMVTPISAMYKSFWYAGTLAVLVVLFGLILPRKQHVVISAIMMIVGLMYFGEFEWFRESIRKPYIVSGYMYGNGIELAKAETYQNDGLLPHIAYTTDNPGADLFNRACRTCHTIDGYKPLAPVFDGTDEAFIASMVRGTDLMKGNMPPFVGTEQESELIAAHIYSKVDNRHLSEIYNLNGAALGEKVYQVRCGSCHEFGGFNDKAASLVGLDADGYSDMLDMAEFLGEGMPAFAGDDREREALIAYLLTLKPAEGGADESAGL